MIDGNGNRSITFSDPRGKVLLNRKTDSSQNEENDTYTLYDIKERVATIYPPDANSFTPNLIYQYFYDAADNPISKKIPDADKIAYVFNHRDLAIGMQSGNLSVDNKWMVTEYDDFGRAIKTGLNTTPTTVNEVWTKTFWDGEIEGGTSFADASMNRESIPKEYQYLFEDQSEQLVPDNSNNAIYKGRVHYTETAILNGNTATNTLLQNINEYDAYGRVNKLNSTNHQGGVDESII